MNNSGDCKWFQHLIVKLRFLTTLKNYERVDFIEGVINIEMKNGQRLRFTHEDVDSLEKFLNESLKRDILNKEGSRMNKWYSHLEEIINQVAYSGKVKRIFCGVDNVEITTNAGKYHAFREVDKSSLESFLINILYHVKRIPTPNCRCVGTPVTDRTDEIIEMLRNTKKDGKICGFAVYDDVVKVFQKSDSSGDKFKSDEYDKIVAYLESLYDEEFTIECEEDIDRVKIDNNPTITLVNGEVLKVVSKYDNELFFRQDSTLNEGWLSLVALKGAKVVQSC